MNTEAIQELASLIYNDLLDDLSDQEVFDLLSATLDVQARLDLMDQLGFKIESSFLAFLKSTYSAASLIEFIDVSPGISSIELLRAIGATMFDSEDLPDNNDLWKVGSIFSGKQYIRYHKDPHEAAKELAKEVIRDIFD